MNDLPGYTEDARMRRLLDRAVSDVEPRPGLDEIRRRTARSESVRRPWIWGVGVAVVATAATITAVAVMGGSPGTTGAQDPGGTATGVPSAAPEPASPTSSTERPTGPEATVPVYYVSDTGRGPRLFREFHKVVLSDPRGLNDALIETVSGPPLDADYLNPWPDDVYVGSVDYKSDVKTKQTKQDVIVVDLVTGTEGEDASLESFAARERPTGMTDQEALMAVQQLVYTAQAASQSEAVIEFRVDGQEADTLLGLPVGEPVQAADPNEVLAQVWIIDPAENARVQSGGFEVTGLANAFEANVAWELMQGDTVVRSGFTTAEECCTMAPYSFTVKAPPGDYTLVVHDEDPSGGEGLAPWQDTKSITVTE